MAIISEVEDESTTRPTILPFRATLDSSNPLSFLEKVFDFLGQHTDFLKKPSAEEEISAAVKAAKEKLRKAEKKPVEKKPVEKESVKPTMAASSSEPIEVKEKKQEASPIGKKSNLFMIKLNWEASKSGVGS